MRRIIIGLMPLVVGLVLGLLLLLATAQAQAGCKPVAAAIAMLRDHPLYWRHAVLADAERTRAVAFINALPPVTDHTFELVVLLEAQNGAAVLLVGDRGMVCNTVVLDPIGREALLVAITGERS